MEDEVALQLNKYNSVIILDDQYSLYMKAVIALIQLAFWGNLYYEVN